MKALHRKALRDLWHMRGQALAIALVIGAGIAMLVMSQATLISLPDKMEEVYQLVITSPYSSEMGSKLEESLSRLRIAEEVASEFDAPELSDFKPARTSSPTGTTFGNAARQAARSVKS